MVENLLANARDAGSIPELERSPGEGNGNHSSILAWKIPWTEELARLQSMGSQRVRHNLPTKQQPPRPTAHEWERGLAGIERFSRPPSLYSSLKLLSQFSSEWESIPKYVVKICSENV